MTLVAVVAGADRSPLTEAAAYALNADSRVQIREIITRPLRPADVAHADIVLCAGHTHYIGREVRDAARLGTVGFHPSLLPRYRGSHPLWWILRNGEHEAGLTLYRLTAGIDSGPIIEQVIVPVVRGDSWGTLYKRVVAEIGPMLGRLVDTVTATDAIPDGTPQDEALATTFKAPPFLEMQFWRIRLRLQRAILNARFR